MESIGLIIIVRTDSICTAYLLCGRVVVVDHVTGYDVTDDVMSDSREYHHRQFDIPACSDEQTD